MDFPKLNPKEKHNYFKAIDNYNKYHDDKLSCYEIAVYKYLLDYHNADKGYAYPSLNQIKESLNISKPTVIRSLNYLEEKELIIRDKGFKGKNTRYYFTHYSRINLNLVDYDDFIIGYEEYYD